MRKLTTEQFINKSNLVHNNKYDYSLVNYINNSTKIKIICPKHGKFEQTPTLHTDKGSGCPKCKFDKLKKLYSSNKKEFIEKSILKHSNKYDYSLVEYNNARINVLIICPEHGIFKQIPQHHLKGSGCPSCKESRGEKEISLILDDYKINYIREHRFEDCKYKKSLPFDFYLPEYNTCIEYDGEQHFNENHYFNIKRSYNLQLVKDNIKNIYCYDNNIKLIRIKYNENITDKLNSLLK